MASKEENPLDKLTLIISELIDAINKMIAAQIVLIRLLMRED